MLCTPPINYLQPYAKSHRGWRPPRAPHNKQNPHEGRKKLVTNFTTKFKTLIPQGKSINQTEKTLWNKEFNFAYGKPGETSKKTKNILFVLIFCYFLLFFAMFSYIFSVAHIESFENIFPIVNPL